MVLVQVQGLVQVQREVQPEVGKERGGGIVSFCRIRDWDREDNKGVWDSRDSRVRVRDRPRDRDR